MDATFLRDIAANPRPTGSPALAAARERCLRALHALGFETREIAFEFSAFPGRFGTPLVGAAAMGVVAVAGHWGARGARVFPLVVMLVGAGFIALLARWLVRDAVLRAPWMRERGVNVEASRTGEEVRVWLCAHVDTKSQPVPTLVRAAGVVLQGIGFAATLLLALAAAAGASAAFGVWVAAAMVTLVGTIPVVLSVVGGRSPGALDNASGVATVLEAARLLGDVEGIGVLLTDAEELGLAGAHVWASSRAPTVVLNCDGVDDSGDVTILQARPGSAALLRAVRDASASCGADVRVRGMPVGLLTDSVAFARHGTASITFSRGTLASLGRVHSIRDDLTRLSGRGIPETARLMAETARRLASTNT